MRPDEAPRKRVPLVETERLVLGGHEIGDFPDSLAMWADPVVTRHIGGRPFSEEEVWSKVLRYTGHWALMGFGYWVVRERTTNRFVGEVGFADFKRDIQPSLQGHPEIGWVLSPWAHGKGFATEAARAALRWLAASMGPTKTVCLIDPENISSIRVANKCGYVERLRTLYKDRPSIVLEREAAHL